MATIDFYDARGVDYFTDSGGRFLSEDKEERESDEDPWARPIAKKLYTPQVAVKLPPPPCNVGRLCSLPRFHLGHCDTKEKLELLTMKKGR